MAISNSNSYAYSVIISLLDVMKWCVLMFWCVELIVRGGQSQDRALFQPVSVEGRAVG